jgi:hypothetical protein
VRPRDHHEERQARTSIWRAEDRRQSREDDQVVDERHARLRLQRSPVDAWGPRGTSTEIAEYARFLEAVKAGRLSAAELIGLAPRAYYAEPRAHSGAPLPEPAIWTGDVGLGASGPRALTAEQILEAAAMLRAGSPWDKVATWFCVAENTLRRHIRDIAPRRSGYPAADRRVEPAQVSPHIELPTARARCRGGVVRWDLPLRTTDDGQHQTVFVECDCGRKRHESVAQVLRSPRGFRGTCAQCLKRQ